MENRFIFVSMARVGLMAMAYWFEMLVSSVVLLSSAHLVTKTNKEITQKRQHEYCTVASIPRMENGLGWLDRGQWIHAQERNRFPSFFNTTTFFTFTKKQGKNNKEHPHCFLSFIFIVPLEFATKTDLLPTKDTKMNERRER